MATRCSVAAALADLSPRGTRDLTLGRAPCDPHHSWPPSLRHPVFAERLSLQQHGLHSLVLKVRRVAVLRDPDQSQKEVPIFEKLWPHLEAMRRDPAADPVFVVAHPRNEKGEITNLSQQFHRHLKRAGIKAWPKLFQNLRSTRQTEVAAVFDEALACRWLGNSPMVFRKHYLQVSPDVIERATAARERSGTNARMARAASPHEYQTSRVPRTTAHWGRNWGMHMLAQGNASRQVEIRQVHSAREIPHRAIIRRGVLHPAKPSKCPREDLNLHPVTWTRT